ncbi:hypothetical protein SAE02_72060 [Skermanella aerolata]|uniref:Uncharacterized protein n=1 Tax=Skermanella aerolata TaxID=393310 RepID=A0A512E2V1_9PROT|nr:hypothetical protein [Skermanella aerolata]KJB90121.1 hypothetical protein N826_06125 [Skermanella aerolata KACC 11604]GEO43058.1 hypothetical protein SAE02_72060 [Skermanella aerolata]
MTFAALMVAANDSKNAQNPGREIAQACKIWREAEPQDALLLKAAIAWELASDRRAQPANEAEVRKRCGQIEEATAAQRAAKVD